MAAAAGLSPAGGSLGSELSSVGEQPADVNAISWSKFAVVLRAAAATRDIDSTNLCKHWQWSWSNAWPELWPSFMFLGDDD